LISCSTILLPFKKIYPDNFNALFFCRTANLYLRRHKKAVSFLTKTLSINNEKFDCLKAITLTYGEMGSYTKAREFFKKLSA
jgi:tetratricopeptide (TPR) repeat protein